jgi:uncharacterized protein
VLFPIDAPNIDPATDMAIEHHLSQMLSDVPWSVKNKARMHQRNGDEPFRSTFDAISKFPETATTIGVYLDGTTSHLVSPYRLDDLQNLIARPTPDYVGHSEMKSPIYEERLLS